MQNERIVPRNVRQNHVGTESWETETHQGEIPALLTTDRRWPMQVDRSREISGEQKFAATSADSWEGSFCCRTCIGAMAWAGMTNALGVATPVQFINDQVSMDAFHVVMMRLLCGSSTRHSPLAPGHYRILEIQSDFGSDRLNWRMN